MDICHKGPVMRSDDTHRKFVKIKNFLDSLNGLQLGVCRSSIAAEPHAKFQSDTKS